jgi:cation diffusion facilitator family transporter
MAEESRSTVLVALATNTVIALAKIAAGVLGGSSAMLAEGAHSVADTFNEVFLLTSLHKSSRPPDDTHPFGYGKERFFWSLLAAIGIFVSGSVFSLYQGITGLLHGGEETDALLSYIVLAAAFIAEGTSFLKAVMQLRGEARRTHRGVWDHIKRSTDPTVKTVASEDSAALVGLVLAALGVGLHQLTGQSVWDSAAAIAIGVLLAVVAFFLGRDTKELLIGEAVDPELRAELMHELESFPEVDAVVDLLSMRLGPEDSLLAVRLDLVDGLSSDEVERVSSRIDRELQTRHPEITQVFLDATRASARQRSEANERGEERQRHQADHPTDE